MSPSCHLGRGLVSYVHVIEMDRDRDTFIKEIMAMPATYQREIIEPAFVNDFPKIIDEEMAGSIFDKLIDMERAGTVLFVGKRAIEKKSRWKKWRK